MRDSNSVQARQEAGASTFRLGPTYAGGSLLCQSGSWRTFIAEQKPPAAVRPGLAAVRLRLCRRVGGPWSVAAIDLARHLSRCRRRPSGRWKGRRRAKWRSGPGRQPPLISPGASPPPVLGRPCPVLGTRA